jgi:hypothetical protein
MNNEKHYYLTPLLFEQDIDLIVDAILQAQNNWGDKRNGTLAWDTFVQSRIDELERVLDIFKSTNYKELPEPPKEI